ncbi:MAG TPA: alpha/beta fold hydrolase [Chthonomonadaceae bacterium]|nr:alpha/beta fold hydrolase [Chthonomonadaceae bacterium]
MERDTRRAKARAAPWAGRRAEILAAMQRVMGPLPGPESRVPLDLRVESEDRLDGYVRRKISYQSAPGERVPAWLLVPTARRGRLPAMLVLHQTTAIGKDEPVGLGGLPNMHVGQELAERGFIVLAPDYPTVGEHQIDVYAHGWQSGSMKSIWDNIRGVDLLQTLREVDGKRIGVIGHSLGGHDGLFTAAFDPRIRCVITNCGFTAFAHYYGGDLTGWSGPRYMPRIKSEFPTPDRMPFDFQDVLAAIAPRALYVSAPQHDANFDVTGVREVVAKVEPIYARLHAATRFAVVYPDCAHDWPPAERAVAYAWLDRQMRRSAPQPEAR